MQQSIQEQNNLKGRLIPLTRLLRRDEVLRLTGIKQTYLYQLMRDGKFPKSVPLGGKIVGWIDQEVQYWVEARIAERDRKLL